MAEVTLNADDAAELAEMLQFLAGWLDRDPSRPGASLGDFAGHPAYNTCQLRQDLDRFIFLLGGDDGESLFGPDPEGGRDCGRPLRGTEEHRRRRLRRRSPSARRACYRAAPGFDKGTLAGTLIGLCGRWEALPDRRQA